MHIGRDISIMPNKHAPWARFCRRSRNGELSLYADRRVGNQVRKKVDNLRVDTADHSDLLGVYSGRINDESDLGKVRKTAAIKEIVESGIPGNADLVLPESLPRP